MRLHHFRQVDVAGLNQALRVFSFDRGVGVVILRHEFSLSWSNR